ncbi:MAG TPA: NAD(P)/FAD-dependent oxidoreductase [Methyloceanibacter sp.]|jgi:thioredoxin reductase|nr:NAD(P)/FAD-dependent oxidoreductase [Methyloceanibacter sp.]
MTLYDVVIAGGGAAGLSAALVLGRCRRRVLVCDDGHPRNQASHAVHCLLGHEGLPPVELLAKGRQELHAYGHVALSEDKLVSIELEQTQFTVTCASGFNAVTRKVLLTTGLQDDVPQIDGIGGLYGRTVHHCPYCDGYENSDKAIAVYGKGDKGAGLALMMKQWSSDVILCTDGEPDISLEMQSTLEKHGIDIFREKVAKLEGDNDGHLQRICFEDGTARDRAAMFFTTGCAQRSDLWQMLGCKRDEKGGIISDPITEESSVPGVYVAGDASRDVLLIAVAIAEGAKAAVAINRALLKDDGLG